MHALELCCTFEHAGKHGPKKRAERPPHALPPATWQLHPDLGARGPLTRDQIESFYRDGFLFIPEFYKRDALADVQADVEHTIGEFNQNYLGSLDPRCNRQALVVLMP